MPDYAMLYHKLFNVQTDVIDDLDKIKNKLISAHQQMEEACIEAGGAEIIMLETKKVKKGSSKE